MEEKDKKEFINIFNEGFEQVVLPHIERLDEKIERLDEKIERLDEKVERLDEKVEKLSQENSFEHEKINRKLNSIIDRQDSCEETLKAHHFKISKLEKAK